MPAIDEVSAVCLHVTARFVCPWPSPSEDPAPIPRRRCFVSRVASGSSVDGAKGAQEQDGARRSRRIAIS